MSFWCCHRAIDGAQRGKKKASFLKYFLVRENKMKNDKIIYFWRRTGQLKEVKDS